MKEKLLRIRDILDEATFLYDCNDSIEEGIALIDTIIADLNREAFTNENYRLKLDIKVLQLRLRNYKPMIYYPWDFTFSEAYNIYNPYFLRENYKEIDSIIFFDKEADLITWIHGDQPNIPQDAKDKRRALADRIKKLNEESAIEAITV